MNRRPAGQVAITTKAAVHLAKVFDEADAATLETSINTWLTAQGEATLVAVEYAITDTHFTALVIITR